MIFLITQGFSGTPTNILPKQLQPCIFETHSEATVIQILTDPSVVTFEVITDNNVNSLLKIISQNNYKAIIDTGAYITGLSNKQVSVFLLKNGLKCLDACVYIDNEGRKMIVDRTGVSVPLNRSGVSPELRFTFYDQIHTTGMDISQEINAKAIVTIGKDMTFRFLIAQLSSLSIIGFMSHSPSFSCL